jgi:putative thymidine phosphorylase
VITGGVLVAFLNAKDASELDLHPLDRIKLIRGKKEETVVVDITTNSRIVPPGRVGVVDEVKKSLSLKHNDLVRIKMARKPLSLNYIKKKLDGCTLTRVEIDQIIWDIVHNKLSTTELTYFVSACYTNTMTLKETILLTKAMTFHGDVLKLKQYPIIDKHCIGGIPGNRTTMIVVPIIAAAGLTIPKTSSRSITSPAGTADTMEILTDVSIPITKLKSIVNKINGCIVWGGALNLAPADDKIIKVERPLNIDAESQLLASIFAKKLSVNSTHILIDIPVGHTAKVKRRCAALKLKKDFEIMGKHLRRKIKVLITNGNQPIGNGVGPVLEARDVLWVLRRDTKRPLDLEKKSVMMAAEILEMSKKVKPGRGYSTAKELLESGEAYAKMLEIVHAQGRKITNPDKLKPGEHSYTVRATRYGTVKEINNEVISKVARVAGAPEDPKAGIYIYKHVSDRVKRHDKLFTIYAQKAHKLNYAKDMNKELRAYKIT